MSHNYDEVKIVHRMVVRTRSYLEYVWGYEKMLMMVVIPGSYQEKMI